jgi:hypothetical protein
MNTYCLDARAFARTVVASDLVERAHTSGAQLSIIKRASDVCAGDVMAPSHIIMNLPNNAIDFLGNIVGEVCGDDV